MPFCAAGSRGWPCELWGMKKYIRQMFDDLNKQHDGKNSVPPPDSRDAAAREVPAREVSEDLENQELSPDPEQRVRQLDQQAQDDELRETLE